MSAQYFSRSLILQSHFGLLDAGRQSPKDRDVASAVAAALSISGGANIIRMHNAVAGKDAARLSDAVLDHGKI